MSIASVPSAVPDDRVPVGIARRSAIFILSLVVPGTGLALAGEFRGAVVWFLLIEAVSIVAEIEGAHAEGGVVGLLVVLIAVALLLTAVRGFVRLARGRRRKTAFRGNVLCISLIAAQIVLGIATRSYDEPFARAMVKGHAGSPPAPKPEPRRGD